MSKQLRSVCTLLLLAVAMAACVPGGRSRVGVRPVTADLIFGIPPLDEPVGLPDAGELDEPFQKLPPRSFGSGFIPKPVCDEADSKEVRLEATNRFGYDEQTTSRLRRPPIGEFKWKASGHVLIPAALPNVPPQKLLVDSTENRTIKDFKEIPSSAGDDEKGIEYTFVTEQREFTTKALIIITWHVIADKFVVNRIDGKRTDSGLNGLFIDKIVESKASGVQTTFNPDPEILVLPYGGPGDIDRRFGFQQAYADSNSQETWQLQGIVKNNMGLDACGEMVDSRWVDGYLKVVSAEGTFEHNWDYGIGTQFGAMFLGEHLEACPRDYRYVHALTTDGEIPSYNDGNKNGKYDQGEEIPEKRCERASGAESGGVRIDYSPVFTLIDRNIGQIPPD